MLGFCWLDVRIMCRPELVCTSWAKLGTAILCTESPCFTVTVCVKRCRPSLILALPTFIRWAFKPAALVVVMLWVPGGLCDRVPTGIAVYEMNEVKLLEFFILWKIHLTLICEIKCTLGSRMSRNGKILYKLARVLISTLATLQKRSYT